jgi:hypothetical protein
MCPAGEVITPLCEQPLRTVILASRGTRTIHQNSHHYSKTRPKMTIIVILNVVLSTAVLAAVLSLLVWSITTQHRSLPRAEMNARTPRAINSRLAPHDQSDPLTA